MAADPGVAVDGGPPPATTSWRPNGAGFKLTSPLGPGQSVELPARVHVGPASGPGRVRLGASATGRYGDGPLAVPAAGDIAVEGVLVDGPAVTPPTPVAGATTKNPVERKAQATAGVNSATGSGGRKPARASVGVSGAAGSAASAAPVTPAPTTPRPGACAGTGPAGRRADTAARAGPRAAGPAGR